MNWGSRQIRWARRLDALLGSGLSWLRPGPPRSPARFSHPNQVRRILFVKLWGIGSIVLTQPALRMLTRRFPNAELHYLTVKQNRDLVGLLDEVVQVHCLWAPHTAGLLAGTLREVLRLRRLDFDLIYNAEFPIAFAVWLCRILSKGPVVGFSSVSGGHQGRQEFSVTFNGSQHAVRQYLNLAANPPPAASASRAGLWSGFNAGEGTGVPRPRLRLPAQRSLIMFRPYVVVNVNASPLALERRWPKDRFIELGRALLRQFHFDLILIGTSRERAYVAAVEKGLNAPGRVRNLCGLLDLRQLAELIADAEAVVSNDSGPVHLASAFDVPVVAFYGPESPQRYGPLSSRQLVFHEELECSPCMSTETAKAVNCPYRRRCMRRIGTDLVTARVSEFLAERADRAQVDIVGKRGFHV